MRPKKIGVYLATSLMALNLTAVQEVHSQVPTAETKALRIVRAQRGEQYGSGQYPSDVRPAETADVVLLLEIAGLTDKEWQAIDRTDFYVMAGDRRCEFRTKLLGMSSIGLEAGAKATYTTMRQAVFVVPRTLRQLTLHVRGQKPISFTAEQTVKARL